MDGMVKVNKKGEVHIPKSVRDAWGIRSGDILIVTATPEGVLFCPENAHKKLLATTTNTIA